MAQIVINIPDQQMNRVINAFCSEFSYQANGGELTKQQFTKKQIRRYIKEVMVSAEIDAARSAAAESIRADVDSINID